MFQRNLLKTTRQRNGAASATKRLHQRLYIRDAINKVSSISREDALVDKTNDNQLTRVPFVVTYNPKLPILPKILNESHNPYCMHQNGVPLFFQECLSSATQGQETLATCSVADILHLTPLQSQIETLIPATTTTITLIKEPTPIKTTRVMRAKT